MLITHRQSIGCSFIRHAIGSLLALLPIVSHRALAEVPLKVLI